MSGARILLANRCGLRQSAAVTALASTDIGPTLGFAGQDFVVVGGAALYWPAQAALIVADLHLEKASWFAARGQMLPPYDSRATLEALAAHIDQTGARQLWCLGDNFHDNDGVRRLESEARQLLASLIQRVDWHWIIGNHDHALTAAIGGRVHDEAALDGLILRHQACAQDQRFELSGHFHPKLRVGNRARSVSRACFVRSNTKLILPAFGAFTGGMHAGDPAIMSLCNGVAEALVPAGARLLTFPL
jgi:uncharacterized protein